VEGIEAADTLKDDSGKKEGSSAPEIPLERDIENK
jgi:hypothetical protein